MRLPFRDHIINGLDVHFDKYGKIVLAMAGLVPSIIAENDVSVINILDMYSDDLPSPLFFFLSIKMTYTYLLTTFTKQRL